jgi:hypothetical protein
VLSFFLFFVKNRVCVDEKDNDAFSREAKSKKNTEKEKDTVPEHLVGSTVGSCWDRPSALRSAWTLNLTQQTEEEEDKQ